jgi:hypothetical protein
MAITSEDLDQLNLQKTKFTIAYMCVYAPHLLLKSPEFFPLSVLCYSHKKRRNCIHKKLQLFGASDKGALYFLSSRNLIFK